MSSPARSRGARAGARKIVWSLLAAREQGFPWVEIAGKTLTGWVVIDMDATIVEASSAKEGAAGTFKGTFGHHPLAAWCTDTFESLAMKLRPGNAGTNDAADHVEVFTQALRQLPSVAGFVRGKRPAATGSRARRRSRRCGGVRRRAVRTRAPRGPAVCTGRPPRR